MKKKLYLVKREVYATSVKQAIMAKGKIYSIAIAEEEYQPSDKPKIGFGNKSVDKKLLTNP